MRVARALGSLPHLDDALRRGRISYSKARALTRVATPENEQSLLEMARCSTASQLERICRGYRRALNGLLGTHPVDEAHRRWIRDYSTQDGMIRIEIQVSPEEAAMVRKAIELAMERSWRETQAAERAAESEPLSGVASEVSLPGSASAEDAARRPARAACPTAARDSAEASAGSAIRQPEPPRSFRRVDAFVAVAESYLASASDAGQPPVEVVVHVEADSFTDPAAAAGGTLDDGTSIPRATADRLACDASVVTVVEDAKGTPLDVGRRRRTIPTALRRALRYRDRGCRFPGCTNRRVDGHHVRPWSHGGVTSLANLCSLCRVHHRYVHELGFRIEPRGDGAFAFFNAAGHEIEPVPAAPACTPDAVDVLRSANRRAGAVIDAQTSFPRWDGTPPDYDHIVYVLAHKYGAAPRPD